MIDNGGTMSAQLNDQSAELAALLSRTSTLVDSMATQSDSFVRGMAAAKNFTEQLESNAPVLIYLTDHSPAALNSAQQLFDKYHNTFGAVLANLVTVAPIISDRTDALETGLVTIPEGLAKLASIVKGDRADFALVATQGPVCNYDTPRREVGDLSPTSPESGDVLSPRRRPRPTRSTECSASERPRFAELDRPGHSDRTARRRRSDSRPDRSRRPELLEIDVGRTGKWHTVTTHYSTRQKPRWPNIRLLRRYFTA